MRGEGFAHHEKERNAPLSDEAIMRRAIALARTAAGWTNPNPLVGAVVVKDGRVIGQGCHERFGQLHAERNALKSCKEDPAGATIYVTLEPCNHTGHQPPCVDALIEAGIAKVVVGSRDPNPLVSGKGNARLRAAGIEVEEDFLRDECDALNPIFFHYITTKRPYVVSKWAMTVDGKISAATGDARWVSNEASRADTHELRQRLAGIMVGINTVLADNPELTCRRAIPSNNPTRIVCDSQLRIPLDCTLVATAKETPVIVACACDTESGAATQKAKALAQAGVSVVRVPGADGRVDLNALMTELGKRQIDSLLVEGGGTLHAQLFAEDLVDRVVVYVAPKVIGGATAKTPVGGVGIPLMADAIELGTPRVDVLDGDVKLTYVLERGL
jgi:diaminohydroxyphosphoribosylaminopyrimidine deaminase/5-amino-6-(5-phosphoribosylamino)uracil reductase